MAPLPLGLELSALHGQQAAGFRGRCSINQTEWEGGGRMQGGRKDALCGMTSTPTPVLFTQLINTKKWAWEIQI